MAMLRDFDMALAQALGAALVAATGSTPCAHRKSMASRSDALTRSEKKLHETTFAPIFWA